MTYWSVVLHDAGKKYDVSDQKTKDKVLVNSVSVTLNTSEISNNGKRMVYTNKHNTYIILHESLSRFLLTRTSEARNSHLRGPQSA